MQRKYISVDVETSGPTPGKYSMLSLGACVVGDSSKTFYRELKPINRNFIREAMKKGCQGLQCIKNKSPLLSESREYDPYSSNFNPKLILNLF